MQVFSTFFFILFVNIITIGNFFTQSDAPAEIPHYIDEVQPLTIDHAHEIAVGQSGMFFGHFKHYAYAIRNGINALFNHINKTGGVNGKKIRLISMEDFGNPVTAQRNVEYLVRHHNVKFFMGNMGTRSLLNLLPMLKNQTIALLFPWGGSKELQDPTLSTIINGPGLLEPQLLALIDYAKKNLKINKVAIFHADDSFSQNAARLLANKLKEEQFTTLGRAEYNRFTMDIMPAAESLINLDPKLVFCISTSIPAVKLINQFFVKGHFGTIFLGIDSTTFVNHIISPKGITFYSSSCVPSPFSNILIAQKYRQHLEELMHDKTFNTLSFTYYLAATIVARALQTTSETASPVEVVKAIEAMKPATIDGITVSFNPENRHIFGQTAYIIQD